MKRNLIGLICVTGLVVSACYMGMTNERVIKLKPGFGEDSFTITFNPDGGTWEEGTDAPKSITVTLASGIPLPAQTPVRDGYVFNGWFSQQNGRGAALGAATEITEDTTVYAYWMPRPPDPVTITFDKNGGKYDASPREKIIEKDTAIAGIAEPAAALLPQEPYRENYHFAGWNTQADGLGNTFEAATVVSTNFTVYAQWVYQPDSVKYIVTFNSDDADTPAKPGRIIVSAADGNAMPATLPEKTGCIFGGWYTGKNGTGDSFDASYTVTGNLTVYAKWTLRNEHSVSITITFDPNGGAWKNGNNAPILIPVTPTSGIPIPAQELTQPGYEFTGWNTKADGSGDGFGASYVVSKNIPVYAQWQVLPPSPVYITFDKNGGKYDASPAVIAVTQGTAIGAPPQDPFREGHDFIGWKDQSGGDFNLTGAVTADITVYAQWSYNPNFLKYTVTFDGDGADTEASPHFVKVSANGGNTMPSTLPQKTGKLFSGWYTQKEGRGAAFGASFIVSADMTVYACWTEPPAGDMFTVTFDKNGGTSEANPRMLIIKKGEALPLNQMPQDPVWEGHHVTNWTFNQDGNGGGFNSSYAVNSDITVYAQWDLNTYTVSFEMNGANSPRIPDQAIKHGSRASKPVDPQKQYFDFDGWYWERAPLPDLKWDFSIGMVPGDITLYARWEYKQPITDMNRIEEYLQYQKDLKKGGSEYDPVLLEVEYDLGMMSDPNSNWQKLLRDITEKGIYVKLDLSKATLTQMTDGEFDPVYAPLDPDVQKGKSYIISLTLPDAAKKITYVPSLDPKISDNEPPFDSFVLMTDLRGRGVTETNEKIFSLIKDSSYGISINNRLRRVDFPNVKKIGESAFMYCTNLEEALFKKATDIGANAFMFDGSLSKIDFEKVERIGVVAFYGCVSLKEARFPNATEIGTSAFVLCTSLTTLRFPKLVEIGEGIFYNSGIRVIDRESFPALKKTGNYSFSGNQRLETAVFDSVTEFGEGTFGYCQKLKTLICEKVEKFGSSVFATTGDTPLTIKMGKTAPIVDSNIFDGILSPKTVTVQVPTGATTYTNTWKDSFIGGNPNITVEIEYQ